MSEIYPIPSYAVNLWVAGDDLWLAFPGQGPEGRGRGHSLRLPASVAGFQTAITILRERQHSPDLKLGNRGTPTQYDLETISRYMKATGHVERQAASREEREAAARELQELGL